MERLKRKFNVEFVFLTFACLLVLAPAAGADVILKVNSEDLSGSLLVVPADDDILISVEGSTKINSKSYYFSLEECELVEAQKPKTYYFNYTPTGNLWCTVSMVAKKDMLIDDILVPKDGKIYELIFFYFGEENSDQFPTLDGSVIFIVFALTTADLNPPPEPDPHLPIVDELMPSRFKAREETPKSMANCPQVEEKDPNMFDFGDSWDTEIPEGMDLGGDSVVYVDANITTNTYWTNDNTYHVLRPIDVNGGGLFIERGTTVLLQAGIPSGIRVINGGVIKSNGITYTSSSSSPNYDDYYCAVYITETASTATEFTGNTVEWAYVGLAVFNKSLDKSIEGNRIIKCTWGIHMYGTDHTPIINNLLFDCYYGSIEVYFASYEGLEDANSVIVIENNTCKYSPWDGICVYGVSEEDNAGLLCMGNNLVSDNSRYGVCLADGWMYMSIWNTGYYNNYDNKNWAFDENDPVVLSSDPYKTGTGFAPMCYLDQDCDLIDAGIFPVQETSFIGWTTDVNGVPDNNQTDIGFHYPNPDFSNTGEGNYYKGDLDESMVVDFNDFAIFANYWQQTPNSAPYSQKSDIDDSGFINALDLAFLVDDWLYVGGPIANITPSFSGDPNDLSGDIEISIDVSNNRICRAYALIDGEKAGEFFEMGVSSSELEIPTQEYSNGQHSVKIVCQDEYSNIFCSLPMDVNFSNGISFLTREGGFTPGEDYRIRGIASGDYDITLEDIVNETISFTSSSLGGLDVTIPAGSFPEDHGVYKLAVSTQLDSGDSVDDVIGRKFRKKDFPQDCNIKMVVSIGSKDLQRSKEKCWKAAVRAAVRKGIHPVFLSYKDCTWDNLSYCILLDNVKFWYHCSHGHYKLPRKPVRTSIETRSGKVFSFMKKDYLVGSVPPDYEDMGGYEKSHTVAELGLRNSGKMKWTQINACYSFRYIDFGAQMGIYSESNEFFYPPGRQIYIGWKNSVLVYDIIGNYNQFEEDYWDYLRQGLPIDQAVDYALPPGGGTNILENFTYYGALWDQMFFDYYD